MLFAIARFLMIQTSRNPVNHLILFKPLHTTLLSNPSLCSLVHMGVQITSPQLSAGTACTACSALLPLCINSLRIYGCFPHTKHDFHAQGTCLACSGKAYLPSAAVSVQRQESCFKHTPWSHSNISNAALVCPESLAEFFISGEVGGQCSNQDFWTRIRALPSSHPI